MTPWLARPSGLWWLQHLQHDLSQKGDGQDAATGASSTAQAGREILGKLILTSDLHLSKSGALCVLVSLSQKVSG